MTVLVRSKRGEKGSGRRRASAFLVFPGRQDAHGTQAQATESAGTHETRSPSATARGPVARGRSRRDCETFQDNALYSCHCGFVFEAAVSTQVDCPHCGTGQAW